MRLAKTSTMMDALFGKTSDLTCCLQRKECLSLSRILGMLWTDKMGKDGVGGNPLIEDVPKASGWISTTPLPQQANMMLQWARL